MLLTRTVNYRRPQSVPFRTYAYTGPRRPAIEAQILTINSPSVRFIHVWSRRCGGHPRCLAATQVQLPAQPGTWARIQSFSKYPARSHSSNHQARPLMRPALSSGLPLPLPANCPLQVSKQAARPVCIWPSSFVPTRVEAASTTHTRLVMTAACLRFQGQANPLRRRSSYRWHITALPICSTWLGEYDE